MVGSIVLLIAGSAAAHIHVTSPVSRGTQQKEGPCGGGAGDTRGEVVHSFRPGQTIVVEWDETVDHPGHFRISFDADGQDDFVDPASFTDLDGNAAILIDGIADGHGGSYRQEVTLPAVECDRCTLQVVQVMTDKPPYGDGNDLYYQCVDLVLSEDAEAEATTSSLDGASGGCDVGGGGPGAVMLLCGLLAIRRIRRACR
ncbi:MAG TPA: SCE4755 family polysaccharide monooxygenase-like protein [Nannocystis sp.]